MDETGYSIVAQVAAKAATELYIAQVASVNPGGFDTNAWDTMYRHIGAQIIGSTKRALAAEHDGRPFDAPPLTNTAPEGWTPAPQPPPLQSPPAAAPLQQPTPTTQPGSPQQVVSGPPCPQCQTPTVMTKDYAAKKARNLSEGKKAPPLWRCPMGSYDPASQQAQGCQGAVWEQAA